MIRLLGLFCCSSSLYALVTAYVTFDTPEGWKCELAQGVWICQSGVETHRKDSVVLSIATLASEWDSLDNYENYLKQARQIQDEEGNSITAKVSYVRKRNINGVVWVDSLQFNSELPGFWARYLATVHVTGQTKLAILITYIVSDDKYSMFAPQFERMVASLKPNAEFDLNIATKQGDGPLPGSERLGSTQKILAEKKVDPGSLDRIICSVDPPEGVAPNAAALVQERIGARCPAYEISMSCAGWACGVDYAVRCIATGEQAILVLAANRVGSVLPFKNLMHRAIFGDGAGGALITAANRSKLLATSLWTDGSHYADIFVPLPWTKTPSSVPLEYNGYFYMNPEPGPFHDTMRNVMPVEFKKLLRKAGLTKDDIDLFLLHEPSKPLYELSLKLLGIPREKTLQNFERYGNTVSAEMPLLLDEAIREKKAKEGDLVLIFTYGAGFTMGSMIFEL